MPETTRRWPAWRGRIVYKIVSAICEDCEGVAPAMPTEQPAITVQHECTPAILHDHDEQQQQQQQLSLSQKMGISESYQRQETVSQQPVIASDARRPLHAVQASTQLARDSGSKQKQSGRKGELAARCYPR